MINNIRRAWLIGYGFCGLLFPTHCCLFGKFNPQRQCWGFIYVIFFPEYNSYLLIFLLCSLIGDYNNELKSKIWKSQGEIKFYNLLVGKNEFMVWDSKEPILEALSYYSTKGSSSILCKFIAIVNYLRCVCKFLLITGVICCYVLFQLIFTWHCYSLTFR